MASALASPVGAEAAVAASSVSALSGPVTRTWTIVHAARTYTVQLFHNTITGDRSLSVDGAEIAGSGGTTTMFHPHTTLVFEVGGGATAAGAGAGAGAGRGKGQVSINYTATTVEYRCTFEGVGVPEENSLVAGGGARSDEAAARMKITVDAGDQGFDESAKPVVWFRVHTVREVDERETIVHRRFRDFFAVNEALRSAYTGSHLLSSFPSLPPRGFKLWEDHSSAAFVEKRRWQLQDYLVKLAQVRHLEPLMQLAR